MSTAADGARAARGSSSFRLRLRLRLHEEDQAQQINCIKSTRVHRNGGGPLGRIAKAQNLLISRPLIMPRAGLEPAPPD